METLRLKIEQLIEDLENETENRHMNDMEQGRYDALNEVLEIIDERNLSSIWKMKGDLL